MNTKLIFAAVAVLAITVAAWVALRPDTVDTRDTVEEIAADAGVDDVVAPVPETPATGVAPNAAAPSPRALAAPGRVLLEVVGNDHAFDPQDAANEATSVEDAAWLHRYGFPDPDAYDRLRKASEDELRDAAETDLRAQVILAYNLAASGRYGDQPFALLEDAVLKGSIFALVTWGDIHFSLHQYRNPALGAAYYQLALRRGYYTAATKKYAIAGDMSAEQRLISDVFAEAAWLRFQAGRKARGVLPFADADLRPGFDQFLANLEASFIRGAQAPPE